MIIDYSYEYIKYFLYGCYIRYRELFFNPGRMKQREERQVYFICDGCKKKRLFYATYPIKNCSSLLSFNLYCWNCWKRLNKATIRLDPDVSLSYMPDDEKFYSYLDMTKALENIKFSTRQKQVLYFYMKEYDCRLIADNLNISHRTVRGHLHEAIKKIYEFLNGDPAQNP